MICPIRVGAKVRAQLARRGWTEAIVRQTILYPARRAPTQDTRFLGHGLRENSPATVFYRGDGHYVVRNDVTGDIVQVSNTRDPNWIDPFSRRVGIIL